MRLTARVKVIRIIVVAMALDLAVSLCSCRSLLHCVGPVGTAVPSAPALIQEPFQSRTEHIPFTRAAAAVAIENYRIRPVSTVTGKQMFTLEDCRAISLANNLDVEAARLEEIRRIRAGKRG